MLHPRMYRDTGNPLSTNVSGAAPGRRGVIFTARSASGVPVAAPRVRRALMEFHVVDSSQMFSQSKGHGTKAGEPLRAAVHTVRIRVAPPAPYFCPRG